MVHQLKSKQQTRFCFGWNFDIFLLLFHDTCSCWSTLGNLTNFCPCRTVFKDSAAIFDGLNPVLRPQEPKHTGLGPPRVSWYTKVQSWLKAGGTSRTSSAQGAKADWVLEYCGRKFWFAWILSMGGLWKLSYTLVMNR